MPAKRQSSRTKKEVKAEEHDSGHQPEEGEGEGSDFEEQAPRKKKGKTTKVTKPKGKTVRGAKLSLFNEAPLDVLSQILKYLDPQTLLALSRTCRVLRNLVTGSGSKKIWEIARKQVDLPNLRAGDLTDWAYASLIYDKTCHDCQKSNAPTVDYVLRGRGCSACMRKNSVRAEKLGFHYHPKTLECVPVSTWMEYEFYWVPTVQHVSSLLYAASTEIQPGETESPFDKLVEYRKEIVKWAAYDGRQLKIWENEDKLRRKIEKKDIGKERKEALEEKMRELGYGDNEFKKVAWCTNSLVTASTKLTDSIWKRNKEKLIIILEQCKLGGPDFVDRGDYDDGFGGGYGYGYGFMM